MCNPYTYFVRLSGLESSILILGFLLIKKSSIILLQAYELYRDILAGNFKWDAALVIPVHLLKNAQKWKTWIFWQKSEQVVILSLPLNDTRLLRHFTQLLSHSVGKSPKKSHSILPDVKQCYQTGQFQLHKNAQIEELKCDILSDFQTLCLSTEVRWKWNN